MSFALYMVMSDLGAAGMMMMGVRETRLPPPLPPPPTPPPLWDPGAGWEGLWAAGLGATAGFLAWLAWWFEVSVVTMSKFEWQLGFW